MTAYALPVEKPVVAYVTSPAATPPEQIVAFELGRISHSFLDKQSLVRSKLFEHRLASAIVEASEDEWDGEGTVAVRQDAIDRASTLFHLLPSYVPAPEVSVTPVGSIAFEWQNGPDLQLSLILAADNRVGLASFINGESFQRGFDFEPDRLPLFVFEALSAWTHEGTDAGRLAA